MYKHDATEVGQATEGVYIDFTLRGVNLDVDNVTQILGISPSLVWRRGEAKLLRDGRTTTHRWSVWHLRSSHAVQSDRLKDHVNYLLNCLEGKTASIRQLRTTTDYSAFYIHYGTGLPVANFSLSSVLFGRLLTLVDEINFSVVTADSD